MIEYVWNGSACISPFAFSLRFEGPIQSWTKKLGLGWLHEHL